MLKSLTGSGVKDWLLQRISAYVMLLYIVVLGVVLFTQQPWTFTAWQDLFHQTWCRVFTLLVVLNVLLHAWIGIWTVTTDYLKCAVLRTSIQVLVMLWLVANGVWAIRILWG